MGYEELIEALRSECNEKIRILWKEAEAEAEKLRKAAADRRSGLQNSYETTLADRAERESEWAVSEAEGKARSIRLDAEEELSTRLRTLAEACLSGLRNENYPGLFRALAGEMPSCRWQTVRVNPLDIELARSCFPEAEISGDPLIEGGMEVSTDDGRVKVVNTFRKRLERAWDDLLPLFIKDSIRGERCG